MEQPRVERRLAAVLAADVAGYSRLIGADEEDTLARLKAVRAHPDAELDGVPVGGSTGHLGGTRKNMNLLA